MKSEVRREQVQSLLDLLRSGNSDNRLDIAAKLRSLKVDLLGEARTRGDAAQPAFSPLPGLNLAAAVEALTDPKWEARQEVVLAIGDWGDHKVISALENLNRNESEWPVRSAVAQALSAIGGPVAVDILSQMVRWDPHPVVANEAVKGLTELVQASREHAREGLPVRGRYSSDAQVATILDLLETTRYCDASSLVRSTAAEMLGSLGVDVP